MATTLLSVTEAERLSGLHRSWLRRCINDGRLKAEKYGSNYMIRPSDLAAFLEVPRLRGVPLSNSRGRSSAA